MRAITSLGFASQSCSGPRFHFSSVPGRKFSVRTSLCLTSSSSSSWPFSVAQVERAALLVPRLDGPPERAALVARLPPLAERVGLARRLDLDDLGAHVAEQPAGERPREEHPQLDHPDAGERPRAAGLAPRRLSGDCGVGHQCPSSASGCARTWETSRSRASNTCSFMTSSARSASLVASALTICRW